MVSLEAVIMGAMLSVATVANAGKQQCSSLAQDELDGFVKGSYHQTLVITDKACNVDTKSLKAEMKGSLEGEGVYDLFSPRPPMETPRIRFGSLEPYGATKYQLTMEDGQALLLAPENLDGETAYFVGDYRNGELCLPSVTADGRNFYTCHTYVVSLTCGVNENPLPTLYNGCGKKDSISHVDIRGKDTRVIALEVINAGNSINTSNNLRYRIRDMIATTDCKIREFRVK